MFAFSIRLRMWWASISTAVLFSPPLGTMMSAFRPQDAAEDALIGVGIYINFVVEQLAQLRLHKGQDALHDEDGGGLDVLYLIAAVVVGVIVHRAVDGAACFQLLQVVDQQGVIKGIRVVVVQFAALLKRQLVVALVIAVVGDEADFILPKPLFQPQGQRGLAAAGPAGKYPPAL